MSADQSANKPGCDDNDCCQVEKTGYYTSGIRLAKLSWVALPAMILFPAEIPAPQAESVALSMSTPDSSPPFLVKSWLFISRAALPVRAPSLVS